MQKRFVHEKLNTLIDKYGWVVTGVGGGALYTVGLVDEFNHPELTVYGLPTLSSYGILVSASNLIKKGVVLHPGSLQTQIAVGYDVKLVSVDPSNLVDWFGQILDYHGKVEPVLQIVWPDKEGRFPGNPDFDPNYAFQKVFDHRHLDYDKIDSVLTSVDPSES